MCIRWALCLLLSRRICMARLEIAHCSLLLAISNNKTHVLSYNGNHLELITTIQTFLQMGVAKEPNCTIQTCTTLVHPPYRKGSKKLFTL